MRKSTLLAIVVFLGLVAATWFSLRQPAERGVSRIAFPQYGKDKVSQLTITGPNPIELKKTDGKWQVSDGKPAEMTAVNAALDAIGKIDSSDVVTSHSDRYADLEVDETKGTHVVAWEGAKHLADFISGKAGAGSLNIRSGDSVYAVRGIVASVFSKPAAQWHQLKMFDDKLDDVTRVDVAVAGTPPYALMKKDAVWGLENSSVVPAGFRFDSDGARGFVTTLVNLSAKEILDKDPGAETTKLNASFDSIAFTAKDGAKREVHLGAALADKTVYAKVAGRDDTYTLQEFSAKALRKSPADFREMTLMKLDADKVKKLMIVNGSNKLTLTKDSGTWAVGDSTEKPPADFTLDQAQVMGRLRQMINARALRVATAEERAKLPLVKPAITLTATLDDGSNVKLVLGGEGKEGTQAVVFGHGNADDEVYAVSKFLVDRLSGGLTTFKPQPAPSGGGGGFDASQLANLPPDVRAQLMKQMQQKTMPGMALGPKPAPAPSK